MLAWIQTWIHGSFEEALFTFQAMPHTIGDLPIELSEEESAIDPALDSAFIFLILWLINDVINIDKNNFYEIVQQKEFMH